MAVLEVSGLHAGYGETQILYGVDLTVNAGEIVCVIGPNGAGKSTLLKVVVGLVRATAGTVLLVGEDVTNLPPEHLVRRGIVYVPQVENVFPSLTVRENLELMFPRTMPRASVEQGINQVLEMFPQLKDRLRHRARVLSGGERQMLALARGVVLQPKVLILDEPTAAVAPVVAAQIFEKIREINAQGVSVLMVEQNADQALRVADRGYILESGRNALTGTGPELLSNPEVGRLYLGAREEAEAQP